MKPFILNRVVPTGGSPRKHPNLTSSDVALLHFPLPSKRNPVEGTRRYMGLYNWS